MIAAQEMLYQKLLLGEHSYFANNGYAKQGFEEHRHPEFELNYCFRGFHEISVEGKKYQLHAGDLILIPPMASHEFYKNPDTDTHSLVLVIGPTLLGRHFELFKKTDLQHFTPDPVIHRELIDLLAQTSGLCCDHSDFGELTTKGNIYKICAYILRFFLNDTAVKEVSRTMRTVSSIEKAITYVHENYQGKVLLEDAALLCGYSKSTFCKTFKNITGETFHSYLNHYRVKICADLLADTDLSLEEAARQTGFSDVKNLCRIFKSVMHTSPGEYRKAKE